MKHEVSAYTIIGDFHTHTLASQHAYSTVNELIQASRAQGFVALSITDHGPEMLDGAISHHFFCMSGLPSLINGVHLYKGAEVNIKSFAGRLDLDNKTLCRLDFIIASYHIEAIAPGTEDQNTEGWLNVIANPYVDCLGHAGNPVYPFDHEAVVQALAAAGKILEINANSFSVRPGSEPNCQDLITRCKAHGVPVLANSDAHNMWQVGNVGQATDLLKKMKFPPEMILNTSFEAIDGFIRQRKKQKGI